MSYSRGGTGVNKLSGESNNNAQETFGISCKGEEMSCELVVAVTSSTQRWLEDLETMDESELTTRIYKNRIDFRTVKR